MDAEELKRRTKDFAHRCIKLAMALAKTTLGNHIKGQLIRCSTSVAANYRSTCIAQSKPEFVSKWNMSFTVIARKYRSQTFDDVVGQDPIAQTLRNAIKTDRVAHAYLFSGTRGVGKTTMARILAKALNCLAADKPTTEPCCKCDSCISVNTGADIDVIEIDGRSEEHTSELQSRLHLVC